MLKTILACMAAFLLTAPGCTKKDAPEHRTAPHPGRTIFAFDYSSVESVTIMKNDPRSGDRWNATAEKSGEDGLWKIISTSAAVTDLLADGSFIEHLLDTLSTITVAERAPAGPPESFGLAPPVFALRWFAGAKVFEARLGPLLKDGKRHAVFPSGAGAGTVVTVQGSALDMLLRLKSFDDLRQKRLATFDADDVETIEVMRAAKRIFHASRDGDIWRDASQKAMRIDVQPLLERLAHFRITAFIDDARAADSIKSRQNRARTVTCSLHGRHGALAIITAAALAGRVYGTISTRAGIFEMPLEFAGFFETLP